MIDKKQDKKMQKANSISIQTHRQAEIKQATKTAVDSHLNQTIISINESMCNKDINIARMAEQILDNAKFQQTRNYKNISELVLNQINFQHQKYINYDSMSEHSSSDQIEVDFDAEAIVDLATTETQFGKMTFISKIIKTSEINPYFLVNTNRPFDKEVPAIQLIRSSGNFALYELQIHSKLKKATISLKLQNQTKAITKQFSFLPRIISLDLPLSYDFKKNAPLKINKLEGLLASCILQGEEIVNQIIKLSGKKQIKSKILSQNLKIDEETRSLIRQNQNNTALLKLLVFLLQQQRQFATKTQIITNTSYLTITSIFLEQMLKFKFEPGMQRRDDLPNDQIIKIVQMYLHLICLSQLNIKGIVLPQQKQSIAKIGECIQFAFQSSKVYLYHNYIKFCLKQKVAKLPQGYDTILEYASHFNLKSPQVILVTLQNILYNVRIKKYGKKALNLFIDAFKNSKFQTGNIYGSQMSMILSCSTELFKDFQIQTLSLSQFKTFYKIYSYFEQHPQINQIIKNNELRSKITRYVAGIKQTFNSFSNLQKINGLNIIQNFYISNRDKELILDESSLSGILSYLINTNKTNDQVIAELIRIYFQIVKRGDTIFPTNIIRDLSVDLSKALSNFGPEKSFSLLKTNFRDDLFPTEAIFKIFDEDLMSTIVNKIILQTRQGFQKIKKNQSKWHFQFKFPFHFNELLLQRIIKVIKKIFNIQNKFFADDALNQIKMEINRYVDNIQYRDNLLAMIEIDLVVLDREHIWEYFLQKRSFFKMLVKILQNNDEQSDALRQSLAEISNQIDQKQVKFTYIERLKNMKQNEWNQFIKLTGQYQIPQKINQLYNSGVQYRSNIRKLQNFVRELTNKYMCVDGEQILQQLQNALNQYENKSISKDNLQILVPVFANFKYDILKCYRLKPFYGNQNLQKKTINQIVQFSNKCLQKMFQLVDRIFSSYASRTLMSEDFYVFNPKLQDVQQFTSILFFTKHEEITDSLQSIVNIYKMIAEAKANQRYLFGFIKMLINKFGIKQEILNIFAQTCGNINRQKNINVSQICRLFDEANAKLSNYKLSLKDAQHKNMLEVYSTTMYNYLDFKFLVKIQKQIQDLKEKVQDDGGEITYQELENCQTVLEFWKLFQEEEKGITSFLNKINKFIQNKRKINKRFDLAEILNEVFGRKKEIEQEMANFLDSNRAAVKIIDQINKKVAFQLKMKKDSENQIEMDIKIFPEKQDKKVVAEKVSQQLLMATKQKAILLSATLQQDKKEKKKQIKNFLETYKMFEQIKANEQKLVQWGFKHFQSKNTVITIEKGQKQNLIKHKNKRQNQLNNWVGKVKTLFNQNFKAAHLQGKNLKQFFQLLQKPNDDEKWRNFLFVNDDRTVHNQIMKNISIANKQLTPMQSLDILSGYFKELKTKDKQIKCQDFHQTFFHCKIMPKGQGDFMEGIEAIGKVRMNQLKFDNILISTKQTKISEIKSFIERALRDHNSEYVILGYQNLDGRQQQFIVDEITTYKREVGQQNFKLKLCLVGDSEVELLYKFSKSELAQKESDSYSQNKAAYANLIKKLTKQRKIQIVCSTQSGLGKTQYIINDYNSKNKGTLKYYYLPLSGRMNDQFLWKRFNKLLQSINSDRKNNKDLKVCLIVQIYNIDENSLDGVNRFVTGLSFGSYMQDVNRKMFDKQLDISIYFQLQNITLNGKAVIENTVGLPSQLRVLPFLKQLKDKGDAGVYHIIQKFQFDNVTIKQDDLKLNFICNHLRKHNNGSINTEQILPFNQYKLVPIPIKEMQQLIKKFFFDSFPVNDRPSAYLWKYFSSLLFEAVRNFSSSFFLKLSTLKQIDDNVKQFSPKVHQQMKIKSSFRSQFIKVTISNCLEFIKRSVRPGQQGAGNQLQQMLQDLPFLIIPNADKQSFSFIYNKSNKVPPTIKSMIVLQQSKLMMRLNVATVDQLFEEVNLAKIQLNNQALWVQKASQILNNISGNNDYKIDCEKGYIVNIDNFFKMCLITQRMRLNIPIVIMGEAGIGKTALLRHVVNHLYKHQFAVYNINAGLPLESSCNFDKDGNKTNVSQSLSSIVEDIKIKYDNVVSYNAQKPKVEKKLWVFFDQFNTLKELGYFKEIIIDGRFLGQVQAHTANVVMMAACNPHTKLKSKSEQQQYVKSDKNRLAFDVLPAPHSLIQCMWNYGALTKYQYNKYIGRMLSQIKYKNTELSALIQLIHEQIGNWLYDSAVSLRDIDRLRQQYAWFHANLPNNSKLRVYQSLGLYNNKEERAIIMALYFTYVLRFNQTRRKQMQALIEDKLGLNKNYVGKVKKFQQSDLCERLDFNWDSPIAVNDSLKENIYSCFVCINTRLPLLIIGSPGCSKSLSLRLLAKNLRNSSKSQDDYLKKFKNIRPYALQGSQNSTSNDVRFVFEKAYAELKNSKQKPQDQKQIKVIIFDQIGLAQKSKDNPLKMLHPYLQSNRDNDIDGRVLAFIGISNSQLDVSKMSRLLVLRRPPATKDDLIFTADGIASAYPIYRTTHSISQLIVKKLTQSYIKFVEIKKQQMTNYPLFYGLRDFYGVIKGYMKILTDKNLTDVDNHDSFIEAADQSIFSNFHGWQGSYEQFKQYFYELCNINQIIQPSTYSQVIDGVLKSLESECQRYPLVIVDDQESASYVKWCIQKKFDYAPVYLQGSPFKQDKDYSLKFLSEICRYMSGQNILILSNLNDGVKTGLYDFFNKSFIIKGNHKQLKIRSQQQSLSQKNFRYNQKFNCVYILKADDLQNVDPPFISRFQKYRFNIKAYMKEKCGNLEDKVKRFGSKIEQISVKYGMSHFKKQNIFVNISQSAIQSLTLAVVQSTTEELAYNQAIKRIILNSGQQFFLLFKYYIKKNRDLPQLIDLIQKTLDEKMEEAGDRNLIIRFTNDPSYMTKYAKNQTVTCMQFMHLKKQADLSENIYNFYKSRVKQTFCIGLRVLEEAKYLNYVIGLIQKIKKRFQAQQIQQLDMSSKRIRLIFLTQRQRIDAKSKVKQSEICLTHFNKYIQQFDDGKLGVVATNREQYFKSVITMHNLLNYVHHQVLNITFENAENVKNNINTFSQLKHEIYSNSQGLFSKHCQEAIIAIDSNFQLNQDNIIQIFSDKDIFKKFRSFKDAITRYIADKKYLGLLALFIKFLCEKEAYLAYSSENIGKYFQLQTYKMDDWLLKINQEVKINRNYHNFLTEYLKQNLSNFKMKYQTLNRSKRLPNLQNKCQIVLKRPRLLPFSKDQCNKLLSIDQYSLNYYIKNIYSRDNKYIEIGYSIFMEEFKKNTTFKTSNVNFYGQYINQDKNMKLLLFIDLLTDFVELNGLPLKYTLQYLNIMMPMLQCSSDQSGNRIPFAKMAILLIGFDNIWIYLFKIYSSFADQSIDIKFETKPMKDTTKTSIEIYCKSIIKTLQDKLAGVHIGNIFSNPDVYTRVYINTILNLQILSQFVNIQISSKMKATRTSLNFLQLYDPINKSQHVSKLISMKSQIVMNKSHYQEMLNFCDNLKQKATKQQMQLIIKFEANQLFKQWFMQEPKNQIATEKFIQQSQNQQFAHNSVATINLFIDTYRPTFDNILQCFDQFNSTKIGLTNQQLLKIGERGKNQGYKDNLSILITNIFIQKVSSAESNQNLVDQKFKDFEEIVKRITSSEVNGLGMMYSFAFVKVFLKKYVELLIAKYNGQVMTKIDSILSRDYPHYSNFRFYCLKLLRTHLPIKDIKQNYIKLKRLMWMLKLTDLFEEQQARSIFVPSQAELAISDKMKDLINIVIGSHGSNVQIFDDLFKEAAVSPFNKYALFNLFMRFFFSLSYNDTAYKVKVIQKLNKNKVKYIENIGQTQFQLIQRYANSKFDDRLKVQNSNTFSEDLFVHFNTFNWFLATKNSKSPFHSLFINNGAFHQDFQSAFQNQFFPCGPESLFINIAKIIYDLTRGNDIGVYICSSACDYIYCLYDCGWPRDIFKCQVCGCDISGTGHVLLRSKDGARRLMTSVMVYNGRPNWAWTLKGIPFYWDVQRCYIDCEINRMKMNKQVTMAGKTVKLTGMKIDLSDTRGRVSSLSFSIFRQNINSILYCLISLNIIKEPQVQAIFKANAAATLNKLYEQSINDVKYLKNTLKLDNKFYGWMYGVSKYFYKTLINFQGEFDGYINQTKQYSADIIAKLNNQVNQKKVHQNYHQIYRSIAEDFGRGLITKELVTIKDITANNRFTRDYFQQLIEKFVQKKTTAQKFDLAKEGAMLQGKMQFPHDVLLTEDKLQQLKFEFSRIYKIPDKQIKYTEIVMTYELTIRQHYPFLDYVLKNFQMINNMRDFANILLFANALAAEMENTYERKEAEKSIKDFIAILREAKNESLREPLKKPEITVASWNRLASKLGTLQNLCTTVGKMDEYSMQSPIKAFLLDNSTKENAYGLFISSIFFNFANFHNDIIAQLNTRKNQMANYKNLNLINSLKKIHPQKIQQSDIYILSEQQLKQKLFQNSISSISYGRNYIFHNFDTLQQYFLMKLLGKCDIINDIKKFSSICFNGEAFAKTSEEGSGIIVEVRAFFYVQLTEDELKTINKKLYSYPSDKQIVEMRGNLQKMMICIKNLSGMINKNESTIAQFADKNQIQITSVDLKYNFGNIEIVKIVHLYETLELALKPYLLSNLPQRYKEKLSVEAQTQIQQLLLSLPLKQTAQSITLFQLHIALFRFIYRNLLGGVILGQKLLMDLLPHRTDFWPLSYDSQKAYCLMYCPAMTSLTLASSAALFSLVEKIVAKKQHN